MEADDIIVGKLIEIILEKSVSYFTNKFKKKREVIATDYMSPNPNLTLFVNKSYSFAQTISVFRRPDHLKLDENSIELSMNNQPLMFSAHGKKKSLSEEDLLTDKYHHILLGQPGAGKTTTLKRLTSKIFTSIFGEESDELSYTFPIVVKLAEIGKNETLLIHLCHQLGIKYEVVKTERSYTTTEIINKYDEKKKLYIPVEKEIDKTEIVREYFIGAYPLKYALGDYLNKMNCILLLDGLDEINYQIKDVVFTEIKELSNILVDSKIILTSRNLVEISSFKHFDINEILSLTFEQQKSIVEFWLENSNHFFSILMTLPYKDLANRPLFLIYLVQYYVSNQNFLPRQAIDIYRQIILLAIKEWDMDKEQTILRYSKYKSFDAYKKEDFLSALSFELTYSENVRKTFTHTQLKSAYIDIYKKYPELTLNDSTEILRDIESHNGLVFEAGVDCFEFSHLSLQEYLCAKYILNIPITRKHYELFNKYPAPLAIANVLTQEPEEWFAMLFLNNIGDIQISHQLAYDKVFIFLERLQIEQITFTRPTKELGLAIIYLFIKFNDTQAIGKIVEFSKLKYIKESVQLCRNQYQIEDNGIYYSFKPNKKCSNKSELFIKCQEEGVVNVNYIRHLL